MDQTLNYADTAEEYRSLLKSLPLDRRTRRDRNRSIVEFNLLSDDDSWEYLKSKIPHNYDSEILDQVILIAKNNASYLTKEDLVKLLTLRREVNSVRYNLVGWRAIAFEELTERFFHRTHKESFTNAQYLLLSILIAAKCYRDHENNTKRKYSAYNKPVPRKKSGKRSKPDKQMCIDLGIVSKEFAFLTGRLLNMHGSKNNAARQAVDYLSQNLSSIEKESVILIDTRHKNTNIQNTKITKTRELVFQLTNIQKYVKQNYSISLTLPKCVKLAILVTARLLQGDE